MLSKRLVDVNFSQHTYSSFRGSDNPHTTTRYSSSHILMGEGRQSLMNQSSSQSWFECDIPGCSSRYRRKEHLKRHQAHHEGLTAVSCPHCDQKLTRK